MSMFEPEKKNLEHCCYFKNLMFDVLGPLTAAATNPVITTQWGQGPRTVIP